MLCRAWGKFVDGGNWARCLIMIIVIRTSLILLRHVQLLAEHSETLLSVKESGVKKLLGSISAALSCLVYYQTRLLVY